MRSSRETGAPSRVREGIATTEGFHTAMAAVDISGWDSDPGREILRYLRSEAVTPAVEARRLHGPAREDAIAAGWEHAWLASTTRSVRSAVSPWGAIRVAVERAIGGNHIAVRCGTLTRGGWRRIGRDGDVPVVVATDVTTLELAAEREVRVIIVHRRTSAHLRLGRRAPSRDLLVDAG